MSDTTKIVKTHEVNLDSEYVSWIAGIKESFKKTRLRASVRINYEQLMFNWFLGRELVQKKAEEKWGAGIVEQVSLDLRAAFPGVKGFSTTNLWNIKKWYSYYSEDAEKLHQLGGELMKNENPEKTELRHHVVLEKLHQLGGEIDFPEVFAFVPWRHHVEIITRCKNMEEAFFYIKQTIKEGWSRNALENCIRADMYHKLGSAVTNFEKKLPAAQSELANELLKENYDLGFISLPQEYDEEALEDAIEQRMTRFLLELGNGWAFVGRQKEIIVGGRHRKIDLLFYHIYLRCYVVLELKVKAFDPEFTGKLNFYVNAVNKLLRRESDNPTIGLLICRNMNHIDVQMAIEGITTPMGVATYDNIKVKEIQEQLPTASEIQRQVEMAEEEFRLKLKNNSESAVE